MQTYKGSTPSQNASRIMRRLCKHWSHKYSVTVDDTNGVIELPNVRCSLHALDGRIDIVLHGESDVPERLRGVVAEHLQRMAGEEQLEVTWDS